MLIQSKYCLILISVIFCHHSLILNRNDNINVFGFSAQLNKEEIARKLKAEAKKKQKLFSNYTVSSDLLLRMIVNGNVNQICWASFVFDQLLVEN
jgi:hypothetical protein